VFALHRNHVAQAVGVIGPHIDVRLPSSERDVLLHLYVIAALGEDLSDPSL
jgi:hypothetical protein